MASAGNETPLPDVLADLLVRLAGTLGTPELLAATRPTPEGTPPQDFVVERTLAIGQLAIDGRWLRSTVPRIDLSIDPPVDARALCAAWQVGRAVAVASDPHQRHWEFRVRGAELPDPHGPRVAAEPLTAGRWTVRATLTGRPAGPLPDLAAGASPAYDILERGGRVARVTVSATAQPIALVTGGHPDAVALLGAMAAVYPAWRSGWGVARNGVFVVVHAGEVPVVGAAFARDGGATACASRFCVTPGGPIGHSGSTLLDALEALALEEDAARLALDASVFLHRSAIPSHRHGYLVAPPYDGDTDVPVWAERELRRVTAETA